MLRDRILVGALLLLGPIALCTLSVSASAEEAAALTPREKALIEKVNELEKRVEEMERRLSVSTQQPESAAQLDERLTKVEQTVEDRDEKGANDFRAFWKDGLRLETEDKRFKLRLGGRIHTDFAFFDQDGELKYAVGDEDDGVEFRRARINLQGEIYENVVFRTEYDFAGNTGEGKFKDVYLGLKGLPAVGNVLVGHFREPFGLERCTGVNYHTFMELGLPNVFAPNRNLGIMVHNTALDQRLRWAIGAFKDVDDFPSDDDSDEDQGYAVTARVTGLPWYEQDGRRLLHLGLAYSHRNPDGESPRGAIRGWRTRPESHLANRYLDTDSGLLNGYRVVNARLDDVDLWGAEAALVYGPLCVQGEYMTALTDTDFAGHMDFDGYYIQAGYFLTGEHRPYKTTDAAFTRVHPKRDFSLGEERGWGAWELALRYSSLDLNDGIIRGGQEDNFALGLNWYLNANTRLMLNYIYADIEGCLYEGDLDILQGRFQVDF